MAGPAIKKRSFTGGSKKGDAAARPTKKQRQIAAYHSSSEDESDQEDGADDNKPLPAGLFDSDDNDDLDDMLVDDGESEDGASDSDNSEANSQPSESRKESKKEKPKLPSKGEKEDDKKSKKTKEFVAKDAPESDDESLDSEDDPLGSDNDGGPRSSANFTKSKRNDPEAFATSISKMLSSKLPLSRRADPIVARSAESAAAARQVVDSALEAKARKRLREQKRLAMEKGRVRDVLVPSTTRTLDFATGEVVEVVEDGAESTAQIMATERRLKKVAQRGVVKLFNAVRAAQVKAHEAQRLAGEEGIVGVKRREEKITEMSKKGFLDLIASGGGGLKKGGLEEA
ncbi:Rrp15p-domain-containing protein [Apodospora peruviana]|uniref:Rrp15p-domain-containing protein n=1 Tax=Apodospora peruviana TaxID=516989 RepID=A0AAE0MCG7_9PEZI|nr:Rrp15p-domain-containing protein [Apodospora peruviana]